MGGLLARPIVLLRLRRLLSYVSVAFGAIYWRALLSFFGLVVLYLYSFCMPKGFAILLIHYGCRDYGRLSYLVLIWCLSGAYGAIIWRGILIFFGFDHFIPLYVGGVILVYGTSVVYRLGPCPLLCIK